MFGAIIGDMVGSVYEFDNLRSKDFPFFRSDCWPTDDSIMTIAVMQALLETDGKVKGLAEKTVEWMQKIGRQFPIPNRTEATATARRCASARAAGRRGPLRKRKRFLTP